MAIDSKVSFLGQLEKKLSDNLCASDMSRCLSIVGDILEGFVLQECDNTKDEVSDDLLGAFISSMKIQGKSEKTIDRYVYIINRFISYAKVQIRKINVYHIRGWLASEKSRGIADSTLEGNRQVLSAFFGWLYRESLIDKNPIMNVGTIKVPKKQRKIYTDVDFEKMNQSCKSIRDKAIIHFLKSTGCRISEMTELDRNTVDLKSLECVVHGKGDKERTVYLDAVTGMLLGDYLKSRHDDNSAMFVGKRGERLQPGGVRAMLKIIEKRSGVEHVHPHKFRRTLATELTRHGMPLQEVSSILGHEKIDTTMTYVVLNNDDIKSSYRRFV